jgi:hypothetical protein
MFHFRLERMGSVFKVKRSLAKLARAMVDGMRPSVKQTAYRKEAEHAKKAHILSHGSFRFDLLLIGIVFPSITQA